MLMLPRLAGAWRHRVKWIVSVLFGAAFTGAGAWFLYRHFRYAGFFDPWFTLMSTLLLAAGLALLWFARR